MSQRRVNETSLTATADALRAKLGTSDPITWVENEGFKEAVESIQTDSGGADVSGVTATETEVLENAIFVDAHGEYKEGTIPRNGDTSATMDGIETKSVEIPAGFTTGGTVALDGTIDGHVDDQATLIAEITAALGNKAAGGELQELTVTPSTERQEATPGEGYVGFSKVITEAVPDANATSFGREESETDTMYGIVGNWFSRVVAHVQDMVGRNASFTPEEIVYWLGRVKYIPQGYAESTLTIDTTLYSASAVGVLPDVQKGTATSVLAIDTSLFTSSAVGALVEEEA